MEDSVTRKTNPKIGKLGSSKILNAAESKVKKSKRRKKKRRIIDLLLLGESKVQIEDKKAFENDHLNIVENTYLVSEDTSDADQTTKLPLLVRGTMMSAVNFKDSITDSQKSPSFLLTKNSLAQNEFSDPEVMDSLSQKIKNVNIKQKHSSQNKNWTKQNGSKLERNVIKSAPTTDAKIISDDGPSTLKSINPGNINSMNMPAYTSNESLRWESVLDSSEDEQERLRIYKINRRKRYIADAQAKGLSWALNNNLCSSFQLADDVGSDSLLASSSVYTKYSPMKGLRMQLTPGHIEAARMEC